MSRSPFGWSLPPGCSHRDIEEAMGGNGEAEAMEEAIWERPELTMLTDENRASLTQWVMGLVSTALGQGRQQVIDENQFAADLAAEAREAKEWKSAEHDGWPDYDEKVAREREAERRAADKIDGYDRDDLGKSPDY